MHKEVEWLTVATIEKQTGIPNATVRRYIRNHGHHLNIRKKGKSYLIANESIEIMEQIRKLYDDGKTLEQVEEALINTGTPMTVTVIEEDERMTVNVGEALQTLDKRLDEQNTLIQSLVEQMNKQQVFIETKLLERDQRLIEAIRENQEAKKQVAATAAIDEQSKISNEPQKKWYQFWK